MQLQTIQILWHDKQPVFSIDIHPSGLVATCGGDNSVKLWKVSDLSKANRAVTFIANLESHTSAVNCVRFSPDGVYLASGGDYGELIIWKENNDTVDPSRNSSWARSFSLRGHSEDIYDLSWSPDSSSLVSGALEGTAIVWDIAAKRGKVRLASHKHYVQGVAWDPANKYVVTQGGDRTCRIFTCPTDCQASNAAKSGHLTAQKWHLEHTMFKRRIQGANGTESSEYLFHDDTLPSFFRRIDWSPDGSFLVAPSGIYKIESEPGIQNCAFVFARGKWGAPVLQLPGLQEPFVCARFCPVLFSLNKESTKENVDGESNVDGCFGLPYRIIFAVATITSVVIYASEDCVPLAIFGGLHCAAITDIAWSADASTLAISSRDGYCSFARFQEGELGLRLDENSLDGPVTEWLQTLERIKRSEQPLNDPPKYSQAQPNTEKLSGVPAYGIQAGGLPQDSAQRRAPSMLNEYQPTIDSLKARVDESTCKETGSTAPDVGKSRDKARFNEDIIGTRAVDTASDDVRQKKKRRITPVVDTCISKDPSLQSRIAEDTTARLQASASLLFGGVSAPSKEVTGMFATLNKLVSEPVKTTQEHGNVPATKTQDATDPMDEDTSPGGLAALLKDSRFS